MLLLQLCRQFVRGKLRSSGVQAVFSEWSGLSAAMHLNHAGAGAGMGPY